MVAEQVISLVGKSLKTKISILPATPLLDLDADSLKIVEILFELETEFHKEFDEELLYELNTVQDLIDLVNKSAI